jgi:hypothetical protein
LFRTAVGKTGVLTRKAMWQEDAYSMIQHRAADAGIKTKIGNSAEVSERSIVTVGFGPC